MRLLTLFVFLLPGLSGYAQTQGNKKQLPVMDSLLSLPAANNLIRKTVGHDLYAGMVDSLNRRKLLAQHLPGADSGLKQFLQTTLKSTAFAGLKDSTMGEFLYYVKNNFGKDRVQKIIKNFSAAGDSGSINNFIGSKIRGFYSVNGMESLKIPSFGNLVKNRFNGARYNVVHDNTAMAPSPWMHQLQITDQVMLMDIPFQAGFSNLSNDVTPFEYNNLVKFSFDKNGFQQGLQQKLGKYYNMKKFLLADMDMLSYVKKHFESELQQQVRQVSNELITDPTAYLNGKISYDELLKLDIDQIKEKIQPAGDMQAMRDKLMGYEQLLKEHGANMSASQKDSLAQQMKGQAAYLASLEQITGRIGAVKNKLAASGINANSVTRLQQALDAKASDMLEQPGVIKEAAGQLLPLNGLQRFFTNVSSLNAGTFGMPGSERSINTLIRGGMELSLLKNANLFSGGLGQIKDGGFLKDAGLQNSIFSSASFMQFLQFGKGETGKNNTKFTVINSNTNSPNTALFNQLSLPRNVLAGTISKSIKVRKAGMVEAELSKSATQYNNTASASADQLMEHKSALYSYADDLWQTISAGVRYSDEWEQIGLSHNAHVAYAGFGYNNPGNPSSSKGSWQYDLQLRKQINGSKGFVQTQFANRNYNYSANGGQRWNNLQFSLQGRYRFSRIVTLGGRFNQYQLVRNEDGSKEKMYVSRKVMADAQYAGTLGGKQQRSNFSLGWQQFDNIAVQQGGNSNLVLVQWATSMPFGNTLGMMNVFYNKEIADHALMGNLLTADLGAGYTLFKSFSFSSSLTYLDNNIAARQLGLRQTVNTTVWDNCSIGVYIDWRKDLITPVNSYLYGNFRGELSLHYQIK